MSSTEPANAINNSYNCKSSLMNITNVNITVCPDRPSAWVSLLGVVLAFVVILFGGLGNAITIVAYKRNRKLQNSFNHLITNLCAIDLVFSTLVMPFLIPLLITASNLFPVQLCQAIAYVYNSLISSSVINLVFIAVNRYVGIVHSTKYPSVFSSDHIKWWLCAAWLSGPLLYLPLLITGEFCWVDSNLGSTLSGRYSSDTIKVYVIVLQNALQLLPTFLLIVLYREIFKKVKRCRKIVEHHPTPVSRSPSYTDLNDGSRIPKGRFRTLRRQSSFNIPDIESPSLQKIISSPQSSKTTSRMAYLQVPDSKSSPMVEIKRNSYTSYQGGKLLPFRTEILKAGHSSPDILSEDVSLNFTSKEMNTLRRSSSEDESVIEELPRPLLTSERPRKRLLKEMLDWQIMSTIESEPTSKTMSFDHGDDTTDAKSPAGSIKSTDEKQFLSKGSEKFSKKRDASLSKLAKVVEHASNCLEVPEVPIDYKEPSTCNETIKFLPQVQIRVDSAIEIKGFDAKDHESGKFSLLIEETEETRKLSENIQTTTSFSSPSLIKRGKSSSQESFSTSHVINPRRHSISTCSASMPSVSDKNNNQDEKEQENLKLKRRRSIKSWSWKRKKQNSAPITERKSLESPKLDNLNGRRIKFDSYPWPQKPWKKTWSKKTNAANIKIVIDRATSEDTVLDSVNLFSDIMHEKKLFRKQHSQEQVEKPMKKSTVSCENIFTDSKSECCRNFITRIKRRRDKRQEEETVNEESKSKKRGERKHIRAAISVESLPSTLPSQTINCNSSNKQKQHNFSKIHQNNQVLKDFLSSTNQNASQTAGVDVVVDSSDVVFSDERRSSITSHVYRYGAEEGVSRNGSFSYVSCADDYTRNGNNNRITLKESGSNKKEKSHSQMHPRRSSTYISWKRKSFCLSSFNSSATSTESHRRKRRRDAEKQLVCNGFIICIALAICILPLYITELLQNLTTVGLLPNMKLIVVSLTWLQALVNPVIYGLLNSKYRSEFKNIWRDIKVCCSPHSKNLSFELPGIAASFSNRSPQSRPRFQGNSRRPSKSGL